jgi:hypothetical protein
MAIRPGTRIALPIVTLHAQGGLAIALHPFDRSVPLLGRAALDHAGWDFDAIRER